MTFNKFLKRWENSIEINRILFKEKNLKKDKFICKYMTVEFIITKFY